MLTTKLIFGLSYNNSIFANSNIKLCISMHEFIRKDLLLLELKYF